MRLIDADVLITWFNDHYDDEEFSVGYISGLIKDAPTVDIPTVDAPTVGEIIQRFSDYQIEWLKSHCDLELEPMLETWVVRFLRDTADCFQMDADMRGDEK